MHIINLTPHDITIVRDGGTTTIPKSGDVARVSTTAEVVGIIDGIPIYKTVYGDVVGLPEPRPDTFYLVSTLVAQAVKRPDVLSPGELVRGPDGQPIGCKGLVSWA